jgi:hypothetical protein
MALHPRDRGHHVLGQGGVEPGDRPVQLARGPVVEGDHAHPGQAQGGQDLTDVRGQARALRDHHHALGRETIGEGETQIGQAVQPDSGLAAARAALNDDHARVRGGHDVELARVDERRDLGQVPVEPLLVLARRSQHSAAGNGPGRGSFAARQLAQGRVREVPSVGAVLVRCLALDPNPLRTGDTKQLPILDGDCAPDQDVALDLALAKGFFKVAALGVAVVDLADRGVAPVHDGNAGARIGEGGAADEHVALDFAPAGHALAQAQVREVRRQGIHQHGLQAGPGERNLLQSLHLGDEGGHILQSRLADLIAQGHQLSIVGPRAPRCLAAVRRLLRRRQALHHPHEEPFLLGRDVVDRAVRIRVHLQDEL